MRDIVIKASEDRLASEQRKLGPHINHLEVPATKAACEMDAATMSTQESGTSSRANKPEVPTYRSYRQYLDGYNTLKFKPVRPGTGPPTTPKEAPATHVVEVDGVIGKRRPHSAGTASANKDDARLHKAEFVIQVKPRESDQCNVQSHNLSEQASVCVAHVHEPRALVEAAPCAVPSPPPMPWAVPALKSHVLPMKTLRALEKSLAPRSNAQSAAMRVKPLADDLRACLLTELKAKHPPKQYARQGDNPEGQPGALARRMSEPLNIPARPLTVQVQPEPRPQQDSHQQKEQLANSSQKAQVICDAPARRVNHQRQAPTMLSNPEAHTVTKVPATLRGEPVNRDDPNVKKLVYATLRNYVGAYNNRANLMAAQHGNVVQDKGVAEQIQSITASGNLAHLNGRVNPKENEAQGPPPPPPILSGNIPAARLKSEIGERRNEPPACVQNAMMTKDKKPFTYTPGGIDLSEIKSPRMARRIERNANAPGVGELSQQPQYLQGPQQNRPLPPSALAAMQPQLPVQVFPPGAPPPPPPPPVNAPLPPPPPMQPLPTKPATGSDGVFERPDMTRIIPENPMAMLRKTPKVDRRTFLDELADMERKNNQQQNQQQQDSPPVNHQPTPRSPQRQYTPQPQYSPQSSPQPQSPQQYYSPQPQQPPQSSPQYNRQPSYTTQPQPYSPQPQFYPQSNSHPVPQMVHEPIENNGPSSPPTRTSNVSIGSLYIPPINQQQQVQQYQISPNTQSPPIPPQRQPQSPQTPQSPIPKLNAAPKPWQNQQRREPELPEWAQRHQQSPPKDEIVQLAPVAANPPRVTPVQMPPPPSRPGVEVVYVTQPDVYQHPGQMGGPRWMPPHVQQHTQQMQQPQQHPQQPQMPMQRQQQQQQYAQQEMKGTRIIPIQIEGRNSSPNTPATPERNLSRQQSWTPTQSNSFKVIQKMTNTDDPNDEGNQQQVEYGPRTALKFPADQVRKMNLNDSDRDFMNRVKQEYINKNDEESPRYYGGHISSRVLRYVDCNGVDQEKYLHSEPDPRYRGATIPSKAFRMLQHITDAQDHPIHGTPTVPQSSNQSTSDYVRTIPIQLEGEPQQAYIHPSQQTVEEPRKYMGSAIPSKAFQMLQAMTNAPGPGQSDM